VAAKGQRKLRNPGWRHERHSAVSVIERWQGSRASLGVSSEDLACQGREHRKGSHRWKALWVARAVSLHGEAGKAILVTASVSVSLESNSDRAGAGKEVGTTGAAEVKSYRRRGKTTPAPRRKTIIVRRGVHAPIKIHRSG